jgi:hypothetical protein
VNLRGLPRNWAELPREDQIFHEEQRLQKILKDVPRQQVALCERLIERAAFMLVALCEYEKHIAEEGVITEMPQGKYSITRENPAAKGYNTMLKNYQSVIKQLTDLLPDKKDAAREKAGETLAAFVARGKPG